MSRITTLSLTKSTEEQTHLTLLLSNPDAPRLLEQALQSQNVQNQVTSDIRHLHATTQEIKEIFAQVAVDLVAVDHSKLKDRSSGAVVEFGPRWAEYRKRFNAFLRMSQANAVDAAAFLKQYDALLTCASDPTATLEHYADIKKELKFFTETLERKVSLAEQTQIDFTELAQDVRLFKASLDNVIRNTEADLVHTLEITQTKLGDLQTRLEEVSQQVPQMSLATHVAALVFGAAAAIAICVLSPTGMFTALNEIVTKIEPVATALNVKRQKYSFRRKIKGYTERIYGMQSQQKMLSEHKVLLDTNIDKLVSGLEVVANIWTSLKADMFTFEKQLELALGSDTEHVTRVFRYKISATRELYKNLDTALTQYAKGCPSDAS